MIEGDAATVSAGPETGVRPAYRELLTPGILALSVGMACALLTLFVAVGPMGTSITLSRLRRLAYWGLCGAVDFPICYSILLLALYLVRDRSTLQTALSLAVGSMLAAAPVSAVTYSVYGLFHEGPPSAGLPGIYAVSAINLLFSTAFVYYVIFLRLRPIHSVSANEGTATAGSPRLEPGTAVSTPAAFRDVAAAQLATGGTVAGPGPAAVRDGGPGQSMSERSTADLFFRRLPHEVGRDVIYLKMSGHYLEVVTTVASATILMRLADAIGNLGERGMQVHRSYWVAHRHVCKVLRRDRRTLLKLTGDHEVPVSRTYLPTVRAVAQAESELTAFARPEVPTSVS